MKPAPQPDLFDLFSAPVQGATAQASPFNGHPGAARAPGTLPAHGRTSDGHAEKSRHWLVVTTTRARTACGTIVTDYQFKDRFGTSVEDQARVLCTHDCFDGTVSCARCLEVRG